MLKHAVGKEMGAAVSWLQSDATHLPFADAAFDGVVCANSFHYFRQAERALREMKRVLRPGGWLVLVDWCDDYLSCKLCSWWLKWTDAAYFRTYALGDCERLLLKSGFEVIRRERFRVGVLWGLMRFVCHTR